MYHVQLCVYKTKTTTIYVVAMNAQYYCCYSQRLVTNELEIVQFHCQKTRKSSAVRAEDVEKDEVVQREQKTNNNNGNLLPCSRNLHIHAFMRLQIGKRFVKAFVCVKTEAPLRRGAEEIWGLAS